MSMLDRAAIRIGELFAWGFMFIMAIVAYEVVMRYGFNSPTIWVHEVSGLLAATAFAFGGGYCMAQGSHMRITVLSERAGPKMQLLGDMFGTAAGLLYLGALAYSSWQITNRALFNFTAEGIWDPARSGSTWNPPTPGLFKLALFLGTLLFFVQLVLQFIRLLSPKR